MDRIRNFWAELRANLWFVPALAMVSAVAAALLLVEIDSRLDSSRYLETAAIGLSPEGARSMLTAIASSMITIAGVAFSITIVALSLTASQYSSRVLRNFMSDPTNRVVLGVLVGTFAYCLAVLRTIRAHDEGEFVPSLAVLGGFLLAFAGIAAFVYFIDHIARAIQASHIVAAVARETCEAIDYLFPDEMGDEEQEPANEFQLSPDKRWQTIPAARSGYLQHVSNDALLSIARRHGALVRMERGIGEFVSEGRPLVSIAVAKGEIPELANALNSAFSIHNYRTTTQDASFGIRQLVDVALKALSPGINDTTTANMCLDWLGAVLMRLVRRRIPRPDRWEEGELRVIARGPTFPGMLAEAFTQIRQAAAGNAAVLLKQLQVLAELLDAANSDPRRAALCREAALIRQQGQESIRAAVDREPIEAAYLHCWRQRPTA